MDDSQVRQLRHLTAALVTAIGLYLVASPWLRRFSEDQLLEALWGGAYLLLALGLVGRSRFTLFATSVVSLGYLGWMLRTRGAVGVEEGVLLVANLGLAAVGALLLWKLRHRGSV